MFELTSQSQIYTCKCGQIECYDVDTSIHTGVETKLKHSFEGFKFSDLQKNSIFVNRYEVTEIVSNEDGITDIKCTSCDTIFKIIKKQTGDEVEEYLLALPEDATSKLVYTPDKRCCELSSYDKEVPEQLKGYVFVSCGDDVSNCEYDIDEDVMFAPESHKEFVGSYEENHLFREVLI